MRIVRIIFIHPTAMRPIRLGVFLKIYLPPKYGNSVNLNLHSASDTIIVRDKINQQLKLTQKTDYRLGASDGYHGPNTQGIIPMIGLWWLPIPKGNNPGVSSIVISMCLLNPF